MHTGGASAPHDRHVREVDEVAVRIAVVRLHAARQPVMRLLPAEAMYSQAFSDSSSVMPCRA